MQSNQKTPNRESVLVVIHGDGFVEVFGERTVDVKIARIPHCPGDETLAEDTAELMLPHRFRPVFWPSKLKASSTTQPLLPSVAREANCVRQLINGLNMGAA